MIVISGYDTIYRDCSDGNPCCFEFFEVESITYIIYIYRMLAGTGHKDIEDGKNI